MALVGVDSAVGEEADEVKGSSLLGGEFAGADEGGVGVEGAVGDGGVDAGHVHADDAAGAEVEVADFAVAHLAVGEADEVLAGADEGVGVVAQERVVGGFAGEGDGVAVGVGAVTPAVEDGENYWRFGHDGFVSRWVLLCEVVVSGARLVRITTMSELRWDTAAGRATGVVCVGTNQKGYNLRNSPSTGARHEFISYRFGCAWRTGHFPADVKPHENLDLHAQYFSSRTGGDFFDAVNLGSHLIVLLTDIAGTKEQAHPIAAADQDAFRRGGSKFFRAQ